MRAAGDLDVEAHLQRLEPAQRHAHTGICLAGRDRLQQGLGGGAEIDELDLQPMLRQNALLLCHRDGRGADGGRIPGKRQLTQGGARCGARCTGTADRGVAKQRVQRIGGAARTWRKPHQWQRQAGKARGAQHGPPIQAVGKPAPNSSRSMSQQHPAPTKDRLPSC